MLVLFIGCNLIDYTRAQSTSTTFSFEHLTVDDGLSYSTVHDLLQDDLGMIWVGTRFGLNRYDGYTFKAYLPDPKDPHSIKSQSILCLENDRKGNIWIGHLNGGASILERSSGRFLRFPFADDQAFDWRNMTVRSIFEDPHGHVWLGTYGSGTFVFDTNYQEIMHFHSGSAEGNRKLLNDFVFDFISDPEGRIWIGTAGRGLSVYDYLKDALLVIHSDEEPDMDGFTKSICLGDGETIWVGSEGSGLYQLDWKKLEVIRRFESNHGDEGLQHPMITDLVYRNGHLWIATDGGGLHRYTPSANSWQHFTYQPEFLYSLNSDALYDLMFDAAGNLWIGTFNGGINLHKSIFPPFVIDRQYAAENAEGLRSVLCIDQHEDGGVYMGTDGGGLFKLDVDKKPLKLVSVDKSALHPPGLKVITSMIVLPEKDIWLGTFARGLFKYNEAKGIIKQFQHDPLDPNSLSHNNVWDLEQDADGGLWIATLGGGVCYFSEEDNSFTRYPSNTNDARSIAGTQIIDILLDEKRNCLWVASENEGLSQIDLANPLHAITKFHPSNHNPGSIASDNLRCLFLDTQGTIWIGTEDAGLSALTIGTDQFETYNLEDGLPSNMINSIIEGQHGQLWITTQAGIVRWNRNENRFVKIGSEPFLHNNQYNPKAALQLYDGRLILGSTNGYSIVVPDQVHENRIAPEVVFTEFSLSNEIVSIGEFQNRTILSGPINDPGTIVRLNYQDKGIRFDFTSTDYVQPDKNQFAYRLMKFDTTWRIVSPDQRFATYSSLPGGEYELQVKAANSDGTWSDLVRSIRIVVTPPFWTTWWFILCTAFVATTLIIVIVLVLLGRQRSHFQQKALESQQEILRLQNENLEQENKNKQAQLNASVLQSAHKNQFLDNLKMQIHKIEISEGSAKPYELHRLSRSIDSELSQKDYWDQFQLTFNQVHQDFVHKLHVHHPQISPTDSRLCYFIRMGFSNAEIANILNITVNGVEQSKYRLKRKLGLEKERSVNEYLMNL